PIYTYSLRQGIEDGFLAPYKVLRIGLDKDLEGWRPEKGKLDRYGQEIEDRIYNELDFDQNLVLTKRTEVVANKITEFLKASRLMSTGVDAQTCKLIVLDRKIGSMTEFKQIIGRGTRINEEYNKFFFTIMDFKRATAHFADPDFDGDPVQIYEPKEGNPIEPP